MPRANRHPETPVLAGRRIGVTVGCHSVVDFFSFVPVALMPLLATRLDLSNEDKALLLGVGAICSGGVQPIVALLSDRHNTRALGTIGLAAAALAIGLIGYAENLTQLLIIQAIGALGIGAFHPPGAAAAGHLGGIKRSLAVAAFFLFGMLGGMAGNIAAPEYVEAGARILGTPENPDYGAGLRSLAFLIVPAILSAGALAWAIHGTGHRHTDAREHHDALPKRERSRRWGAVSLLYTGNVIRFTTDLSLAYLFIEWSERVTLMHSGALEMTQELGADASSLNGQLQAVKQLGMGGIGLAMGAFLPGRYAKLALVLIPAAGSVAIWFFPTVAESVPGSERWLGLAMALISGIGIGSVVPVTIALAQRLLPHRTSLASGLMMGGAWVFAIVGPHAMEYVQNRHGLGTAFSVLGVFLLLSALLGLALPSRLIRSLPAN